MEFNIRGAVLRVNIGSKPQLMEAVAQRLTAKRGFALATLNLDHLVKLSGSKAFRSAYAQQDFITADGNPIVWLSRLARRPVDLLPGSELLLPLAEIAVQQDISLALLGSTEAVLESAALALQTRLPGLKIAAKIAPPYGFEPDLEGAEVFAELAASGAGLCFIALGAPKQEVLAALGRKALPQMGFASIGAGLDFLAGHQNRAPKLLQMLALEWLWRAMLSPKRLTWRYIRCAAILPMQTRAALKLRRLGR